MNYDQSSCTRFDEHEYFLNMEITPEETQPNDDDEDEEYYNYSLDQLSPYFKGFIKKLDEKLNGV